MIRVQGQANASHDPKLKVPLVASAGARAAAERTVSTGDVAALRKEIAALTARVAALEVNSHVPVDFTPMLDRIAALETFLVVEPPAETVGSVTGVTPGVTRNVTRNAERQRAYRERKKAKADG